MHRCNALRCKPCSSTCASCRAAADWASQGNRVYPFHLGDLNIATPENIVEAAVRACRDPKHHKYSPAAGLPELREAIEMARRYSKPIMPGALTPTEVLTAWEAGADFVKVFPAGNMGGPKYIKALKGPLPQVEMIPTGGVNLETAGEFLKDAIKAKADVFLTGEMRFHDYLHAEAEGIALLLPGHYATERPAVEQLALRLARDVPGVAVTASEREHDPVSWV